MNTIDDELFSYKYENKIYRSIFFVGWSGAQILSKSFKTLTKQGEFNVILFNVVLLLIILKGKIKITNEIKESILEYLFFRSSDFSILYTEKEELISFVNTRMNTFFEEINKITSKENYLPGILYNIFFVSPENKTTIAYENIFELMKFQNSFTNMTDYVIDSAEDF